MFQRILLTLVMAGLTAVAGAETVYKWVDSAGQVHYTDLPPRQSDARVLGVFDQDAGDLDEDQEGDDFSDEGDDEGDDTTAPASGSASTPEPRVSAADMQAAANDAEKAKVEQCKAAEDRYQKYVESRRLFKEVDGKRKYLSDQELAEARARARKARDDYCS